MPLRQMRQSRTVWLMAAENAAARPALNA